MTDSCTTCKFFRVTFVKAPIKGECHYYAPQPSSVLKQGERVTPRTALWPLVKGDDYCGQHEVNPTGKPIISPSVGKKSGFEG